MAKKKHIIFFVLRVLIALFLILLLFLTVSGSAVTRGISDQLSNSLSGDDSLLAILRIVGSLVVLAIATLLLLKKPVVISVGAFLAMALCSMLLIFCVVVLSMPFSANIVIFVALWAALLASLVVLFRFRGSFPVLGKFT